MTNLLLIEPFYGGSHKQLVDLLVAECLSRGVNPELYTLPAKKWHWRARVSALYFAENIPERCDRNKIGVLFASSVLNLTELIGLRPDLAAYHKILYFHENQLNYPVRKQKERDFQYGYNQVLSCLVADEIVFNSQYNQDSFLSSIQSFFKLVPDHRPKHLSEKIRSHCRVLYFPLAVPADICNAVRARRHCNIQCDPERNSCEFVTNTCTAEPNLDIQNPTLSCKTDCSEIATKILLPVTDVSQACSLDHQRDELSIACGYHKHLLPNNKLDYSNLIVDSLQSAPLHIVWPHRWEHDKGPLLFFNTMRQLRQEGCKFKISVLGESFADVPEVFEENKAELADFIMHWGFQQSKNDYFDILCQADVVVSTAEHEFYGVAMLEAVLLGCYPCCPNKLVYPEIFPGRYLYTTSNQLLKMLKRFCQRPSLVRQHKLEVDVAKYSWSQLKQHYLTLLRV